MLARGGAMPCEHCHCFLGGLQTPEDFQPELYQAGVTLFEQGDPVHAGFIVCKGAVQLEERTAQGSRVILKFLGASDSLIDEALSDYTKHQVAAQTVRDSQIIRLPRASLLRMLSESPHLCQRMVLELARQYTFWIRRLVIALDGDLGVCERLALALLDLSSTFRIHTSEGLLIDLELSSQQWADYVGCRRQTISQAFSNLEKREWIERRGKRVLLKDVEALKQFVRPYI